MLNLGHLHHSVLACRRQVAIGMAVAVWIQILVAAPAQAQSGLPHKIPHFCASASVTSVRNGAWSDSGTWSPPRVPAANDAVVIAAGTAVTYDISSNTELACVGVRGHFAFRPDLNTRLVVGTLMVMEGGHLQIGAESSPVAAGVTAEVVIADRPLDTLSDPELFGIGLIGLGTVTMHGAVKTPTFSRLSQEPRSGQTSLQLAQSVAGWRPGDRLVVPDTRQLRPYQDSEPGFVPQSEELTVAQVSGSTVTLNGSLAFNHFGAKDGNGQVQFLPHVGNLTRNVIVRSENPNGIRGHVILTHRATVDIRYTWFKDLGRTTNSPLDITRFNQSGQPTHIGTNQIGRYALHLHHLIGPQVTPPNGYQYTLLGNAVDGSRKWAITVHNTHHGLVKDNVMYRMDGSGIMTEDGTESFNVFERNFVVRCWGTAERGDARLHLDPAEFGFNGVSYWFRGPNNIVRDNVAAVASAYGYEVFPVYVGTVNVPRFKGADPSVQSQATAVDMNATAMGEFARNESYGATQSGLSIWWVGAVGDQPVATVGESVVKDFRAWHVYQYGYWGYETSRITLDGMVVRGDLARLQSGEANSTIGIWYLDYVTRQGVIRNADIQGMRVGITVPFLADRRSATGPDAGLFKVEGCYLRNYENLTIGTMFSVGGPQLPPRKVVVSNCRFDTAAVSALERPQRAIQMSYLLQEGANLIQRDSVEVWNYNQTGTNFQLYYREQAPSFVVPRSTASITGSPSSGLTNQQNWAQHGIAIAGAIAPCSATRPEIDGFVCNLSGTPPAPSPAAPTNLRIIR